MRFTESSHRMERIKLRGLLGHYNANKFSERIIMLLILLSFPVKAA